MKLFSFLKNLFDEQETVSEKSNPFLDNVFYTDNEKLIDKLYGAGYMWDTLDHDEENFIIVLSAFDLNDLLNYYTMMRSNCNIFDEDELYQIIMDWVIGSD